MEVLKDIIALLHESGLISRNHAKDDLERITIQRVAPDGSARKFYRIFLGDSSLCMAVAPASAQKKDLQEAQATWYIGRHLEKKKLAVPKMFARNRELGLILCDDLGDTKLFDLALHRRQRGEPLNEELRALYRQVIKVLAELQVEGVAGFDPSWCWDTQRYDEDLRFSREAMYFLTSFWQDLLGEDISDQVIEECREIARLAHGDEDYFLHRDFQSRNILIRDGRVHVIDFQGGRLGPLGYDLASLLIDPYVALPETDQEELLDAYLALLQGRFGINSSSFHYSYSFLALQRNLQILGAYAFLYRSRKKVFFKQFIGPSLLMLQKRLRHEYFLLFTGLRQCVDKAVEMIIKD